MPKPSRASLASLLVPPLAALLVACGTAGPSGPSPVPTGAVGSPLESSPSPLGGATSSPAPTTSTPPATSATPSLTPVPGGPTASPDRPTTTQTDWGEIVDQLPIDFPVFPGSHEANGDPTQGPISGAFSAPDSGIAVTQWSQEALEQAGSSTEAVSGPFEDGSTVIDSVGGTSACRVQTTIRPLSGTTLVSVRYGAGCLG
jgi:hypothetical protein